MLTGELPFTAPTVAGILMKQITEPAPDVRAKRPDVPEDLALAVSRCLEKDPENRWPTRRRAAPGAGEPHGLRLPADRDLVQGPAGRRRRTAGPPADSRADEPPACEPSSAGVPAASPSPRRLGPAARSAAPRGPGGPTGRRDYRERRPRGSVPDTGEPQDRPEGPRPVRQLGGGLARLPRHQHRHRASTDPGSCSRCSAWASGVMRNYAQLWQAGYSWRDVLTRPPAPGRSGDHAGQGRATAGAAAAAAAGRRVRRPPGGDPAGPGDRLAILKLMDKLPPSERKMLPEVQQTVDALYERATDLARTLHAMDSNLDTEGLAQIDERIAGTGRASRTIPSAPAASTCSSGSGRRSLDMRGRRSQVASHLESCVLAMQNVRFDLLRLRSAGRGRGAGRPHPGHPAGQGALPRRGQRDCRGRRDPRGHEVAPP